MERIAVYDLANRFVRPGERWDEDKEREDES
jgi:hypothetical protein